MFPGPERLRERVRTPTDGAAGLGGEDRLKASARGHLEPGGWQLGGASGGAGHAHLQI